MKYPEGSKSGKMNGRMYDPVVKRFLSTDPVIQDMNNPENYNRYAYCLNNPLAYVDPSGYRYGQEQNYNDPPLNIDLPRDSYCSELDDYWNSLFEGYDEFKDVSGEPIFFTYNFNNKDGSTFTVGGSSSGQVYLNGEPSTIKEIEKYFKEQDIEVPYENFANNGGSTVDGIIDWFNSVEVYFEAGGKISVGVQSGIGVGVNNIKVKANANVASVTIVEGYVRQEGDDRAPYKSDGSYIGKNGIYKVSQGISAPLVGFEHTFDTDGEGFIPGTEATQFNIGPVVNNNNGGYSIKVNCTAAFILGLDVYLEFGFRPLR